MTKHIPVFKNEVITGFEYEDGAIFVDLTLGGGGHFIEILEHLVSGTVIGFDLEAENILNLVADLNVDPKQSGDVWDFSYESKRIILVNRNFEELSHTLAELGIEKVDGILADLGWSTDQLERIPGLSFKNLDANLDMRFDQSLQVTAADLLNALGRKELLNLFSNYADIVGKMALNLVEAIEKRRRSQPFAQVSDLVGVIESMQDSALHRGSSRRKTGRSFGELGALPARAFQALRIAVNRELSTLQSMLPHAWEALKVGGRLQVITFHSGEEKLMREQITEWRSESCIENLNSAEYARPGVAELRNNLAARSAKLWSYSKC